MDDSYEYHVDENRKEEINPNQTEHSTHQGSINVDELFDRIVDECRTKNLATSYLNKVRIVCGEEQDDVFIQGEGEKRSRKLPKDLRKTSLVEAGSINDPQSMLSIALLIVKFLRNINAVYSQLRSSISGISRKLDRLSEELVDDPQKSISIAKSIVEVSYNFECERLVTARISIDLYIICESKLSKKHRTADVFGRDAQRCSAEFLQLSTEIYDIEKDIKKSIKDLIRDFEGVFFVHPYDIDLDLVHVQAKSSHDQETEIASDDDTDKHTNAKIRNDKPSRKRDRNDHDNHNHASKARRTDDADAFFDSTAPTDHKRKHQHKSERSKQDDATAHKVDKSNHNSDNNTSSSSSSKNGRTLLYYQRESWSSIRNDLIPCTLSSLSDDVKQSKYRFEVAFNKNEVRIIDTMPLPHSNKQHGLSTASVNRVHNNDNSHPRFEPSSSSHRIAAQVPDSTAIADNHPECVCIFDVIPEPQSVLQEPNVLFIDTVPDKKNLIDQFLIHCSSNSLSRDLGINVHRTPNHHRYHLHSMTSTPYMTTSKLYPATSLSSETKHDQSQSTFMQLHISCQLIAMHMDRIRSEVSMKEYQSIYDIHQQNMILIRSLVDNFDIHVDHISLLNMISSLWCQVRDLTLPALFKYPPDKSHHHSLNDFVSTVDDDERGDLILCLVFDYYYQVTSLISIIIQQYQITSDNPNHVTIISTASHILDILYYDILLVMLTDRKFINLCLLAIMSNIPSKCSDLVDADDSLLSLCNPTASIGRFSRCVAFIRLYTSLTTCAVNIMTSLEKHVNRNQNASKLFDKVAWKTINTYIVAASCGKHDISSYPQNVSSSVVSGPRSDSVAAPRRIDEQSLWLAHCLHIAALRHHTCHLDDQTITLIPNNWQVIKSMLSAHVIDVVSTLPAKLEAVSKHQNIDIRHPLSRISLLMKVWSDPAKGMEVFLHIVELLAERLPDHATPSSDQLSSTNLEESVIDSIENTTSYGELLNDDSHSTPNNLQKIMTKSSASIISLFRSLWKVNGVIPYAMFEMFISNSIMNQSKSSSDITLINIMSTSFTSCLDALFPNHRIDLPEPSTKRLVKVAKLAISSILLKLTATCRNMNQTALIVNLMSTTLMYLGDNAFDDSDVVTSASAIYSNALLQKILTLPLVNLNSDQRNRCSSSISILFYTITYGPFSLPKSTTKGVAHGLSHTIGNFDEFILRHIHRVNVFVRWATHVVSSQTKSSISNNSIYSYQDFLFISASLYKAIEIIYHIIIISTSCKEVTVSNDSSVGLLHCFLDSISQIIVINTSFVASLELNLRCPRISYIAISSSQHLFYLLTNLFNTSRCFILSDPIRALIEQSLLPRSRQLIVMLKSTFKTCRGDAKDVDDSSMFLADRKPRSSSSSPSIEITKQKSLMVNAKTYATFIVMEYLLLQQGMLQVREPIPFVSSRSITDLLSLVSLPSSSIFCSSAKVSDIWLSGYVADILVHQLTGSLLKSTLQIQSTWTEVIFISAIRTMTSSMIAMSVAKALYPRAIAIYDPRNTLATLSSAISTNISSLSHCQDPRVLIWIYTLYASGVNLNHELSYIVIVKRIFHSFAKCRRLMNETTGQMLSDDPTCYVPQTNIESMLMTKLLAVSSRDATNLFKDYHDICNQLSRVLNHVKLVYSRDLIPYPEEYHTSVPTIICLLVHGCSEYNRDRTGQLTKDILLPYILSTIKDHGSTSKEVYDNIKCSRSNYYLLQLIPLLLRSISTTPFTSSCIQWNALLCILYAAAVKRFRSADDMQFYQAVLMIWSCGLSIQASAEIPAVVEYLLSRKTIATDIHVYDPHHWMLLQESISAISIALHETADDAGSPLLRHSYANDTCMRDYRKYLLLPVDVHDQNLSRCWLEAIAIFAPINGSNINPTSSSQTHTSHQHYGGYNDLEFNSIKSLAHIVRVDLLARCCHYSSKLRGIELRYIEAHHLPTPTLQGSNVFSCMTIEENLYMMLSMLKVMVKLMRYLLGEAPFALDPSLSYIRNNRSNDAWFDIKDFHFVCELLLLITIAIDSDMFYQSTATIASFADEEMKSLYRQMIQNIIQLTSSLRDLMLRHHQQPTASTNTNLVTDIIARISATYTAYQQASERLHHQVKPYHTDINSKSYMHYQAFEHELHTLTMKASQHDPTTSSSYIVVDRRLHDIFTSPLNIGSNSIDNIVMKMTNSIEKHTSADQP